MSRTAYRPALHKSAVSPTERTEVNWPSQTEAQRRAQQEQMAACTPKTQKASYRVKYHVKKVIRSNDHYLTARINSTSHNFNV
jgi:hypothetical protein